MVLILLYFTAAIVFFLAYQSALNHYSSHVVAVVVLSYLASSFFLFWLFTPRLKKGKGVIGEKIVDEAGIRSNSRITRTRGLLVVAVYLLLTSGPFFYLLEKYLA